MSQEENWKADVEALENAASIIQREERKIEGTNLREGPDIYYFVFFTQYFLSNYRTVPKLSNTRQINIY
jgi:hypothetical protein